jgi:transposase-like protein
MNEVLRRAIELKCPFLDCKSKQVASVGYGNSHGGSNKRFEEQLFQCQDCERKFLFIGDLSSE